MLEAATLRMPAPPYTIVLCLLLVTLRSGYTLSLWFPSNDGKSGGMTGPALNGMAVSAISRASHFASGLQFALANTAKIFLPIVGGWAIDQIGLVDGFDVTAVSCTVVFLVLALMGLVHAKKYETQAGYEQIP